MKDLTDNAVDKLADLHFGLFKVSKILPISYTQTDNDLVALPREVEITCLWGTVHRILANDIFRYCLIANEFIKFVESNKNNSKPKMLFKKSFQSHEFRAWYNMIEKCSSPVHRAWKSFGAKGILIDDRWVGVDGFDNFCLDMGHRPPGRGQDIQRKDPTKDFSPNNCYWGAYFKSDKLRK